MVGRTMEGDFKPPYATASAPQCCHPHFFADRPTQGRRRQSVGSVFQMLRIVVLWVNSVSDIGNIRRFPPRQTGSVGRLLEINEFPSIDGASVNSNAQTEGSRSSSWCSGSFSNLRSHCSQSELRQRQQGRASTMAVLYRAREAPTLPDFASALVAA